MSARCSKSRRSAGYTVMEVMAALGILTAGAAGVVALQKATIISNAHARNLAIANAIAVTWAERVRVDALQWNDRIAPDIAGTNWLTTFTVQPDTMVEPDDLAALGAPVTNIVGNDAAGLGTPVPAFCTQLRIHQYLDGASQPIWPDLLRVEIRVIWDRGGNPITCPINPADVDSGQTRYGAVHLTTSVMRNKLKP
jgi:type IV pilus assembly protein PilV